MSFRSWWKPLGRLTSTHFDGSSQVLRSGGGRWDAYGGSMKRSTRGQKGVGHAQSGSVTLHTLGIFDRKQSSSSSPRGPKGVVKEAKIRESTLGPSGRLMQGPCWHSKWRGCRRAKAEEGGGGRRDLLQRRKVYSYSRSQVRALSRGKPPAQVNAAAISQASRHSVSPDAWSIRWASLSLLCQAAFAAKASRILAPDPWSCAERLECLATGAALVRAAEGGEVEVECDCITDSRRLGSEHSIRTVLFRACMENVWRKAGAREVKVFFVAIVAWRIRLARVAFSPSFEVRFAQDNFCSK